MSENTIEEVIEDLDLGRRGFLKIFLAFASLSTLTGILAPIIGFLIPPASENTGAGGRVLMGTTKDIPVGQGKILPFGNKPIVITNTTQGVKAFSAICTHLGCVCIWDETKKIILCPCHDGHFNAVTGAVMSGPPPAPLPTLQVTVDGEDIYVEEA